jgi:hypothetical protein
MKKLIAVSILFTVLTAAAFAQFKVGLDASFQPDVLLVTTPTGDAMTDNDGGYGPISQDGPMYGGTGTFDFFTTSDTWTEPWVSPIVNLTLSYDDPNGKFGGLAQFETMKWVKTIIENGWLGQSTSITDFFDYSFIGDWNVWGKVGIFKGYVGNTANRGVTNEYNDNFNSFTGNWKIDHVGIITPSDGHLDINNLKPHVYPGATQAGVGYLSVSADLAPITVDVAGDLGAADLGKDEDGKSPSPSSSWAAAGAAFRVSAKAIADIVDFDVIYKFYGDDKDTDVNIGDPNRQPGGEGLWTHSFGVYANVNIIDGLGIGVGYSGTTAAQENKKDWAGTGETTRYTYPYINGIDLRFMFNAVDKLVLTFNNNFSFGAIVNDSDDHLESKGLDFFTGLDTGAIDPNGRLQEISEGYFAMYNALGVSFSITDALKANLTIGNRLNTFNRTDKSDENKTDIKDIITDTFLGSASAEYSFTDNVSLEAGIAFKNTANTYQHTDEDALNWGTFTFGIPLLFKVSF